MSAPEYVGRDQVAAVAYHYDGATPAAPCLMAVATKLRQVNDPPWDIPRTCPRCGAKPSVVEFSACEVLEPEFLALLLGDGDRFPVLQPWRPA